MWSQDWHFEKEKTAFHIYASFRGKKKCFKAHLVCTFYGRSMRMPAKWSLIPTHCSCFVSGATLSEENSNALFQMTTTAAATWSSLTCLCLESFTENKVKFCLHVDAHTLGSISRGLFLILMQNSAKYLQVTAFRHSFKCSSQTI